MYRWNCHDAIFCWQARRPALFGSAALLSAWYFLLAAYFPSQHGDWPIGAWVVTVATALIVARLEWALDRAIRGGVP